MEMEALSNTNLLRQKLKVREQIGEPGHRNALKVLLRMCVMQ